MLIGITGRTKNGGIAGAGKTTVALEIQRLTGAIIYGFSDPIYNMIKAGFGIDGRSDEWQDRDRKSKYIDWLSNDRYVSLRYLLETLGTEWGRQIVCSDLWIRIAERFIEQQPKDRIVIIHDVRFMNEAEWLKSMGGILVHVVRDHYEKQDADKSHVSNIALPFNDGSHILLNDTDIETLKKRTREFIHERL